MYRKKKMRGMSYDFNTLSYQLKMDKKYLWCSKFSIHSLNNNNNENKYKNILQIIVIIILSKSNFFPMTNFLFFFNNWISFEGNE